MSYTYDTSHTASETNWSHGRQGNKIAGITIHHWGSSDHLSFYGIVGFLCSSRPTNPTSAHYVAQGIDENGKADPRVACIVDPDDTAYHAGNWQANLTEIGIECRPHPTDADYAVVAELVADIRKTYGDLPLYPHRHWTSTECPGVWDLDKIDQLARRTVTAPSRDETRPPVTPTPAPVVAKPKPVPPRFPLPKGHAYAVNDRTNLTHSGIRGNDAENVKRIQRVVGVTADGIFGPLTKGAVVKWQRAHHLTADGQVGPATWSAMFA